VTADEIFAVPRRYTSRIDNKFKFVILFFGISLLSTTAAYAQRMDVSTFTRLAKQCGPQVAPLTLAALAKIESKFEPLTIFDNTARRSYRYLKQRDAVESAENLIMRGHSIDIGMMQINSANIRRLGMTLKNAFDPCRSISAAASILSRNYNRVRKSGSTQVALLNAISMYNTGNSVSGFRNGYVRKVQAAASRLRPASELASAAVEKGIAQRSDEPTDESPAYPWDVWRSTAAAPTHAGKSESTNDNSVVLFGGSQ
jgi:type IV secretion system protein VirB1